MSITFRLARLSDLSAMVLVGDNLFDFPIKESRAQEFLDDPRHHLMLAFDGKEIVGMATGVHYVHPDKDPELFINEAGVVEKYQNQGIGKELMRRLIAYAKETLNCQTAWVLTSETNHQAQKAYKTAGGRPEDGIVLFEF